MNTKTPALIATDLRRIANMLDTLTGPMPDCYAALTLQPGTADDDDTIRVIDAIGQALAGTDGVSRQMSDGTYHYGVYDKVGAVRVTAFEGITPPAERERLAEVERLRAELAELKSAQS